MLTKNLNISALTSCGLGRQPDQYVPKDDPLRQYVPLSALSITTRSRVSFAMHMPTRRNVVIKYLFHDDSLLEVAVHHQIPPHPRVVPVEEVIKLADGWCLIFPYFKGGNLIDSLTTFAGADETGALKVFTQLIEGLVHIHGYQVSHCDIKIDNLVLDEFGNLGIIDFGAAVCRRNNNIVACGGKSTLNYMAPELIAEPLDMEKTDFTKSDVFSAGVVFFCLLVGCFPWGKASIADSFYLKFKQAYPNVGVLPVWDQFPAPILALLVKMLNPNAIDRITSVEVLEYLTTMDHKLCTHIRSPA